MKKITIIFIILVIPLFSYSQKNSFTIPKTQEGINQLKKKYRKKPDNLVAIGRYLFKENNFDEADSFAKLSIQAAKEEYKPALELLNDIKEKRLEIAGRDYILSNNFEKAIEAWRLLPLNKMEKENIEDYATAYYFLGDHEKGLKIAKEGLLLHHDSPDLLRTAMMCCVEVGKYEEAIQYGNIILYGTITDIYYDSDYYYLGKAFSGLKQYDNAIRHYKHATEISGDKCLIGQDMIKKEIANTYSSLGLQYINQAEALEGYKQIELYQKADSVYSDLIMVYPNSKEYATFMRARVNVYMDENSEKGLALPHYLNLIEIISSKSVINSKEKSMILEAYKYLISYYNNIKKDINTAKEYSKKLIELDPDNSIANKIIKL